MLIESQMVEGDNKLHVNESDPKLVDLQSVAAEMQRLREENIRLRSLFQEHGIQSPAVQSTTEIPVTTSALPSAHVPMPVIRQLALSYPLQRNAHNRIGRDVTWLRDEEY